MDPTTDYQMADVGMANEGTDYDPSAFQAMLDNDGIYEEPDDTIEEGVEADANEEVEVAAEEEVEPAAEEGVEAAAEEVEADAEVEAAAPAPEPEPEPEKAQGHVPSGVHRKAKDRLRESEKRVAELQRQLEEREATPASVEQALQIEFNATDKIRNALEKALDGEVDLATSELAATFAEFAGDIQGKVSGAINSAQEAAASKALQDFESKQRVTRIEDAVEEIESKYDFLNHENENFDSDLANRIITFQTGLIREEGVDPVAALYEATDMALRLNRPEALAAQESAPAPAAKRTTDVKRNVEVANSQPNRLAGEPNRDNASTGDIDITRMTDDEIMALPESTLARLRGDYL